MRLVEIDPNPRVKKGLKLSPRVDLVDRPEVKEGLGLRGKPLSTLSGQEHAVVGVESLTRDWANTNNKERDIARVGAGGAGGAGDTGHFPP